MRYIENKKVKESIEELYNPSSMDEIIAFLNEHTGIEPREGRHGASLVYSDGISNLLIYGKTKITLSSPSKNISKVLVNILLKTIDYVQVIPSPSMTSVIFILKDGNSSSISFN